MRMRKSIKHSCSLLLHTLWILLRFIHILFFKIVVYAFIILGPLEITCLRSAICGIESSHTLKMSHTLMLKSPQQPGEVFSFLLSVHLKGNVDWKSQDCSKLCYCRALPCWLALGTLKPQETYQLNKISLWTFSEWEGDYFCCTPKN